jgi:replication fork protection complex subunit Tof1/Swi1
LESTDYTVLLNSHAAYKRALVNNPKAFDALLNTLLPSLAKTVKEKQPRDNQIISLVLHLLRNLAFIKSNQYEYITTLSSSHFLDLLLTLGSNALHSNLLLDFSHLLFRGIPHSSLSGAQKATKSALTKALEAEQAEVRKNSRHANTRHNRFGTTVSIRQHNASFIIHKQSAITRDPGELLDASKKATRRKAMKTDETYEALTYEAANVMKKFCNTFIESCFNRELFPSLLRRVLNPHLALFSSVLKDIRSERPHIVEKDNMRLLFLTCWFLEYFLMDFKEQHWSYGLVGEILDVSLGGLGDEANA